MIRSTIRAATGARYLRGFVEDMKASGFVGEALKRHRIEGAAVGSKTPVE